MIQLAATEADVSAGQTLYADNCIGCHGFDVVTGGITPDLRRTTNDVHAVFEEIVIGGQRAALGMPSFADRLNAEEVRQIQAYVLARARETAGEN